MRLKDFANLRSIKKSISLSKRSLMTWRKIVVSKSERSSLWGRSMSWNSFLWSLIKRMSTDNLRKSLKIFNKRQPSWKSYSRRSEIQEYVLILILAEMHSALVNMMFKDYWKTTKTCNKSLKMWMGRGKTCFFWFRIKMRKLIELEGKLENWQFSWMNGEKKMKKLSRKCAWCKKNLKSTMMKIQS